MGGFLRQGITIDLSLSWNYSSLTSKFRSFCLASKCWNYRYAREHVKARLGVELERREEPSSSSAGPAIRVRNVIRLLYLLGRRHLGQDPILIETQRGLFLLSSPFQRKGSHALETCSCLEETHSKQPKHSSPPVLLQVRLGHKAHFQATQSFLKKALQGGLGSP